VQKGREIGQIYTTIKER